MSTPDVPDTLGGYSGMLSRCRDRPSAAANSTAMTSSSCGIGTMMPVRSGQWYPGIAVRQFASACGVDRLSQPPPVINAKSTSPSKLKHPNHDRSTATK